MPFDDDWEDQQRDTRAQKLIEHSDDLSAGSSKAIRRADEATQNIKRLMASGAPTESSYPLEWTIAQESDPEVLVVRGRGHLAVAQCRSVVTEIATMKDPLCPLLLVGRELEIAHLTSTDLMEIESIFHRYSQMFSYSKAAIIAAEGPQSKIVERWSRMASSSIPARISVFTDEAAAREWLSRS